jgi:hypothetical protein
MSVNERPLPALSQLDVEDAIHAAINQATSNGSLTGEFWGRVAVSGVQIEYRAFILVDGTINVGTYYPR